MSQDDRIEQFRKMAKANPDDDLAHFGLGMALFDADRYAEASIVMRQVVKMNEGYSRAYVVLGQSLAAIEDTEGAVEVWQAGHAAASRRGELMVVDELKRLLAEHGAAALDAAATPSGEPAEPEREPADDEVRDHRTGRVGPRMQSRPFEDEIGAWIQANISADSWAEWMEMSIKVINELHLDLGEPRGQALYDLHMREFLGIPEALFDDKR